MKKNVHVLIILILSVFIWKCNDRNENYSELNDTSYNENEKILVNIGKSNKEIYFSFPRIKDLKVERIWKKFNLNFKLKIGGINSDILFFPTNIKIDKNENMYVLDWRDYSVKKFSKDGILIEKFGKKGNGPGEFTKVFNFDVDNSGNVAIINPNDNKFAVFNNKIVYEFKCTLMPGNIAFTDPDEVVTFQFMDPLTQSPFQKVNYKNNTIIEYQNIFNKNSFEGKDFGMLPFLVGEIHRYKSSNIIYISSIMGYVILFSETGKISNVFKLIDNIKESGLTKNEGRIGKNDLQFVTFPKKEDYLFLSSNVYGDNLFVLSNQVKRNEGEYVVDVYSLKYLSYKNSFLLENMDKINQIFFADDKFYITKENTEIEVFEYSIAD
ncbi:MAG: hypothetical protein BroJett005_31060 [Ignavibacteriota bacterium]|nr:MAG: hypothetical protein BroJett005_31060 [Ignavibacteriota bacterium]